MATAMKSVIAAAVLAFYFVSVETTPRYKLCADDKCNSPISEVRALDNFEHQDPSFISFKKDNVITIYGKEETDNPHGLWYGESSEEPGRRGFFVRSAVREEAIFQQNPSVKVRIHIQDTEEDTQPPDSLELNQTPESDHDGLGMSHPKLPHSTNDVLTKSNTDAVTHTTTTFTETDTNTENHKTQVSDFQSASDVNTHSASDTSMHTVLDKDAHGATDSITLSKSDTNAQTASELNTQSASELNFEGARELNTQSASEPNSQSASEPNKQSLSDTHTQNEGDTSVSKASDSDTRSASELNTQSAIEPDTQSASEPDIQTAGGPNTQSLSDTQTQIEGDITIDSSTDIHTYDEHDEINLHQEVVSDSEPNPQVNFEEEYILVLEPVPHSEMETKPQEIDTVLSKLDVQTTETDIHDGNTLLHEVPQIEPEPDTHQQVDAKSQMLTNTGINTDSVEMEDLEPDNSPRINHEGQLTNIETDSESITKAGSSVNAQLNEIHSNTNAETSSQTTGDSVMESEQGQTSDDPENIHDITGISEHNMYSAKNSQTNSVSQNETSIGEQSDLQSKNEQPTLSESFIHHHVSTEGAQLEANAIRAQTDLPTETGTASDAHEYKTTLEMDSTEPDKENRNVHFKESSEYETASNIPDEDQSDNTKNVELVEETLPIQSQLVSVAENDDQERVSQSRDDPGDDLPLDDISLDEQSGLNLSDDEKNEHDVEYHVKRDESAPGEKNESEAPLSDEMKALMNHKIVPRKRRRHDITDEDDEENFLSGVFSAREHHIIHLERSKQEEEESEETKKRKEKTHRKGEKIDHEGSGMERAEAIQPLGLDNYSPRKIEIDMQLMERQLVTDSIPAEEKERVRLRKLRKTKINIEYDLRHHRDEMRGEYLDDEDEEELEEEEDDKKLEPDRNEYGRTIMSKDMSPIMQYGWESGMSPIIESGWESDMNPIMEYGWGGDLINVGDRKTSSQGDEISSKPHMRGGSSLDQNTVEPDFVGLPPGIVIDENTSLTEETHREDVGSEGEEIENEDEEMAGSDQEGNLKGQRSSNRGKCYLHQRHRWLLRYWLGTSDSSLNKCSIRTIRSSEKYSSRCHLQDYFKWMKFWSGSSSQKVCFAKKGDVPRVDIGSHGSKKKKGRMDSDEVCFQERHPPWLFPNFNKDNTLMCRDTLYEVFKRKNNLTRKIGVASKGKYGKCLLQEYHTWLGKSLSHPRCFSISRHSVPPKSKPGTYWCLLADHHYWLNYPRKCPMMPDLSRQLPVQLSASNQEKCFVEDFYVWLRYRDTSLFCPAGQGSSVNGTTFKIPHRPRIPRKCRLHRYFPFFNPVCKTRFVKVATATPRVKKTMAKCRLHKRYPFLIQKRPNQCMEPEMPIIKSKRRLSKCLLPKYYSFVIKESTCKAKSITAEPEALKQKRSKRASKCRPNRRNPFLLFNRAPTCRAGRSNIQMKVSKTEAKLGKCRAVGYLPVQPRHLSCKVLPEKQPMNTRIPNGKCRLHQYHPLLLYTEAVCKSKSEDISIHTERGKQQSIKCKADHNPFKILKQQVCIARFVKVAAATPRVKKMPAKCRLHKGYPFLLQKRPNQCMEAEMPVIKSKRHLSKCLLPKYYPFVMKKAICKAKSVPVIPESLTQKQSKKVLNCHPDRRNPLLLFNKAPTCRVRRSRIQMKVTKTGAKIGKCRAVGFLPVQPRHPSCKVLPEKQAMKLKKSFRKCLLHQYYPLLLNLEALCKAKSTYTSHIERGKRRSAQKCTADLHPFMILQQQVCSARFVKVATATPRVKKTTAKCRLHERYPFLFQKRPNQCLEAEMPIIKSKRRLSKCLLPKYYPFVMKESLCKAKSITAIPEALKPKRSKKVSKCHWRCPLLILHKAPTCRIRRSNIKMKVSKTGAKIGKCRAVGYLPVQPRHLSCKVSSEIKKRPLKKKKSFGKCRLHQYHSLLQEREAVCKAKFEYTSVQIERGEQPAGKKCMANLNPFKILQQQVCSIRFRKASAVSEAPKQKQSKKASKCHFHLGYPFLLLHKAPTCKMSTASTKKMIKKTEEKLLKCRAVTAPFLPVKLPICIVKSPTGNTGNNINVKLSQCRLNVRYPFLKWVWRNLRGSRCMIHGNNLELKGNKSSINRSKCSVARRYPFLKGKNICKAKSSVDVNGIQINHEMTKGKIEKRVRRCWAFERMPFMLINQNATCKIRKAVKTIQLKGAKKCRQCRLGQRYSFLKEIQQPRQCMNNSTITIQILKHKSVTKKCWRPRHPFSTKETTCKARPLTDVVKGSGLFVTSKRSGRCVQHKGYPFIVEQQTAMCNNRKTRKPVRILPTGCNAKMKRCKCRLHERYSFLIHVGSQVKARQCALNSKTKDQVTGSRNWKKCRRPMRNPFQVRQLMCQSRSPTEGTRKPIQCETASTTSKCRLHSLHPFILFQNTATCKARRSYEAHPLLPDRSGEAKRKTHCKLHDRYPFLEKKALTCIVKKLVGMSSADNITAQFSVPLSKCQLHKAHPFLRYKENVCQPMLIRLPSLKTKRESKNVTKIRKCWLRKRFPFFWKKMEVCKLSMINTSLGWLDLKDSNRHGRYCRCGKYYPFMAKVVQPKMCKAKTLVCPASQAQVATLKTVKRKVSWNIFPHLAKKNSSISKRMCMAKGYRSQVVQNKYSNRRSTATVRKTSPRRIPAFLQSVPKKMPVCFAKSGNMKDSKANHSSGSGLKQKCLRYKPRFLQSQCFPRLGERKHALDIKVHPSSANVPSDSRRRVLRVSKDPVVMMLRGSVSTPTLNETQITNLAESNSVWSSSATKVNLDFKGRYPKCKARNFPNIYLTVNSFRMKCKPLLGNLSNSRIIGATSRNTPKELSTVSLPSLLFNPTLIAPSPEPTSLMCNSIPFPYLNYNHVPTNDLCPQIDPSIDPGYSTEPLVEVFTQFSKGTSHNGKTVSKEQTTHHNPAATDNDQRIVHRVGETEPQNNEHKRLQAETEETDEQTNAQDGHSQERGASKNRELAQDEADPDIQVIDGTTLHLSDLLPTPLSDEIHTQILPTPTQEADPTNILEANLNSQEMDLNPTRSTGRETPDREQDEKWIVKDHQQIEDQHTKFLREAENFMKTRSTENMSPQMGRVVKDLMRKGIMDSGPKEEAPNQDLKPSTETQDGPQKSDGDDLKDTVATDDSEIVLPSGQDLDSEKVNNFFNQLMTLPQFLNQPQKALRELHKYIENPSTRVGLTKNEYQFKRQQKEEEKLQKSHEEDKMGAEQTSEDQDHHEPELKTPMEELEESDPEKLLRDEHQSQDDLAAGEAYLQAQEEEMRREKESQMKKGDEGDANQGVMQDERRDTYASSAENIQEDAKQFVDPARLLRESEQQDDQNVVQVEDGQQKINEEGENSQDMLKGSQENGDRTEDNLPEDEAPVDSIPGGIADRIENILLSNLNGEPSLEQITEQATTVEDEQLNINRYEDGQNSQDMLKDNQENGDGTDGLPEDTAPADSIPGVIADQIDTILQSNSNGEPNLEEVIDQGTTAPSLDDVESGVGSPSESEPSGSQDVNLEQNDTPESQDVHLEPTDAPESLQEGVNHKEVYVEVTYPNENELGKEASHQDPLLNNQGHQEMIVLTDEEVQHVDLSPSENSRSAEMHQGHEEMNVLTDAEAPHNDLTSSEHSRSAETHQEIEELFASLDSVDVPNQNHHHESILDAHKMTEESIEEPPKLSRPPTTEDPYLEEMHKMESTVHAPVEEQEMFENMYNTKETDEAPSDAGTILEHSETQTDVKDDATSNPHLEEIVATTPTPPVVSHVHLHVADTKDQQEGNNPSDTGRIFEGGNSDIHSDVEVEVEVEEEVGGDIPSRFNRRQVPLGLDEGNAFSDPGLSTMNDTYDEDHWTMTGINMMKPVLVAINISLQPLMQLLPDDVQLALHGADFLGIPWPILIVIELISCAVFSFLLCLCLCSCRNPKAFNSAMLDEIEALHGQKADILDTLDMTTVQFKTQNRHYYELKQNADKNQKERSKLSQSCKDLKNKIQTLEKELSLIKSTSGQNEKQLSASQQQVDLYEEQVSTASQTITALQQQVYDLERNLHECATTIGMLKQEKQSLSEQNQLLTSTKEQQSEEIEGWNERVSEMNEQVELLHDEKKDLEESVTYKDNEIEVLKDCLLQLKGLDADDELENDKEGKVQQLMDVTRVSAKLSLVEGEKTELEAKYEAEVKGRRELEAKVGAQQQEVDTAKANYKKAKSSLDEALTKLDVMTEYFKNKEVDLQRKLGREEALRLHSDSKLENADEKAATAEVEVTNYRTQIKDLKEELVKAERNYRNQVAAHEKKAHDSWMSVRNAERELQEAKREAANLRHRLTELEGRRAKTEAAPLFKPSPSGREGSPPPTKLGAPSRNSLLADTPSPPRLDQSRALSPGRPIYPGDHPPSPPVDNDYRRSSRSGRDSGPPSFPDDGPPPPHMRRDMDYPPMGRLPPPGRHSRGPPMHDMDDYPHDMRDYSPDGPPPDFGFDPHGPPPPDMDFGPHGPPPFNGPPPPLRHPFPPRDFPPHPDDFDHRGPVPDDRDFGPPMGDHEFGPPRGYGPPPPGMDFGPMGPPPPGGPMHGPGPFPNDMGPPPMDRREPPPPIGRPGPAPGPQNPGIRPNSRGPFPPQTGPSPSGRFPPSGPPFGTPTGPQRRTSTPLEGTPSTPQTRPGSRPAQGP